MIYLDNAATTKPINSALRQAANYCEENFYNPSALYRNGIKIGNDLEEARQTLAKIIGGKTYEVIFTSGGSEADNLAIFGGAKRGRVIAGAGEHSAVYNSFIELKNRGYEVVFAPLNADGSVNEDKLIELVDEKTSFISIVHVNNETGAINDIARISACVKDKNPRTAFHSDGVQAFCKIPFSLSETIDFYSVSAHKIGALKGTGALFKRKKAVLHPIIFGGGQESGYRSGTENVFGIKVFEEAAKIKFSQLKQNYENASSLKKTLQENFKELNCEIISGVNSSAYILSVSVPGVRGEVLQHMMEEEGLIVGTGSACSSRNRHSRILKECGYSDKILDGALRLSFCNENTVEEIQKAAEIISQCIDKLRKVMKV